MIINQINLSIYLYLLRFIHIPEICKYIISIKDNIEQKNNLDYHIQLYNNTGHLYSNVIKNKYDIPRKWRSSYVLDGNQYIFKPDHLIDFYLNTNISYQIIEIIHEIIKITDIEWRMYDDKLYYPLTLKIKSGMRSH